MGRSSYNKVSLEKIPISPGQISKSFTARSKIDDVQACFAQSVHHRQHERQRDRPFGRASRFRTSNDNNIGLDIGCSSLVGKHFFAIRLKAALLPRGIVGKARKMRLEARHGEIHECPDLRNGQPALRGNEVNGHRGGLVLREKDLQRGLRNLLSNMIGKKSGDAASFDG